MEKKQSRFNWFDTVFLVVLVLAVLAALWALSARRAKEKAPEETAVTIRCVLKVEGLREGLENDLRRGDAGYLLLDNGMVYSLGSVVGMQSENWSYVSATVTKTMTDENGETYNAFVRSDLPGRVDVAVTFEVEATLAEDGRYYVGDAVISAGRYMKILTPHLFCEGYCISVAEAN